MGEFVSYRPPTNHCTRPLLRGENSCFPLRFLVTEIVLKSLAAREFSRWAASHNFVVRSTSPAFAQTWYTQVVVRALGKIDRIMLTQYNSRNQAQHFSRFLWTIPLSVLLHNLEEYPRIVTYAQRHGVPIKRRQMGIAVALATLLPFATTATAVLKPSTRVPLQLTLATPSLMAVNALAHLAQTIILRDYSPGTVTGVGLNLPLAVYLYRYAAREKVLTARELRRAGLVRAVSMAPLALILQGMGAIVDRLLPARA